VVVPATRNSGAPGYAGSRRRRAQILRCAQRFTQNRPLVMMSGLSCVDDAAI